MFERNIIEVTSINRPDPAWVFTDAAGHEHRWHTGRKTLPAGHNYELPTLVVVDDPPVYDEDGEEITQHHYACAQCLEHIVPGTCADTERHFVTGLLRVAPFTITIKPKTPDELTPYTEAFLAGTWILAIHPQYGFRFKAFVKNINIHHAIGQDTQNRVDIVVQPIGPPI